MTEISMETCLLDMPYEVLFEIFCTLPKDKVIKISRLCSKFRHVAGDTRLWKNVSIKYSYRTGGTAFQDLYSEPWTVKAIDLSQAKIKPPVSLQTEQMIKVAKLDLTTVIANEVTITAILAKYQCTELNLDCDILRIGPEGFSKQTALEVLRVSAIKSNSCDSEKNYYLDYLPSKEMHQLLAPILRCFKNLKTLDLGHGKVDVNYDMSSFVKSLPTSLEKLFLGSELPDDAFFKLLAKRTPNLRELKILDSLCVIYKSLLEFQFLETLHFTYNPRYNHIGNLYKFLTKFPALKTVNFMRIPERISKELQKMLQSHGIILGSTRYPGQSSDAINSWTYL